MPNRILKDAICTSPTIDALTRDEEVFFYRLVVNCDDYELMDARPTVLRAKLYPLMIDKLSNETVQKYLTRLVQIGLVDLYTIAGQPFLHLRTWKKHQQIRAVKTKYPAPEQPTSIDINSESGIHDLISGDIKCDQVITHAPVIQSESNPNPNPNPNPIQAATSAAPETSTKKERLPNPMWDALVAARGFPPNPKNKTELSDFGAQVRDLTDAGETPEAVIELGRLQRERWPGLDVTGRSLLKHASLLRQPLPAKAVVPTIVNNRSAVSRQGENVDYTLSPEAIANNERIERKIARMNEKEKASAASATPNGTSAHRPQY